MKGVFDDGVLDFVCGQCGKKHPKTVAWLKTNSKFTCDCGTTTVIEATQARDTFRTVDQAMERIDQAMRDFGKKR